MNSSNEGLIFVAIILALVIVVAGMVYVGSSTSRAATSRDMLPRYLVGGGITLLAIVSYLVS